MKILLFIMLTLVSAYGEAQTLLLIDGPMSPFCQVMAPIMRMSGCADE